MHDKHVIGKAESIDDEGKPKIELGKHSQALSGGIAFPEGVSDYKAYLRDFKHSPIQALTPIEYLAQLSKS